ncbi:MAG: HAMP domain-containing sensor histidine kinase [Proteobacteria bacterium]|nr:HAMP domain-containing sensor histidine kinase [Pseudomonadota bacterium]
MHSTLSALVVHDIKNTLALLEIDLEQLNHRKEVPPEGRRAYRRCVELKSRLINFLTLYKHDQSGLNPLPVEIDLPDFIEDLIQNSQSVMMAESHHGHPVTVRAAFDRMKSDGAGVGVFDENLVELSMESALNNAVRYARHTVDVWFEQEADKLVFKVLDDGVGVGMEDELMQRKIAEKSSSTGLGLALCKAVAQAHGSGSVLLESAAGGGTLFTMTLSHVG